MANEWIKRIRKIGMAEVVSYLLLLGIAMPLKYFAGLPEAVLAVGWAHGVLFMAYAVVVFLAWGKGAVTFSVVAMCAAASLLPFGPFLIDGRLKNRETIPKQ